MGGSTDFLPFFFVKKNKNGIGPIIFLEGFNIFFFGRSYHFVFLTGVPNFFWGWVQIIMLPFHIFFRLNKKFLGGGPQFFLGAGSNFIMIFFLPVNNKNLRESNIFLKLILNYFYFLVVQK